jgi:hypothetical protein
VVTELKKAERGLKVAAENEKVYLKYTELFHTPLGKEVLADLEKIWRQPPAGIDVGALAHLEGQRHVVRYIETQIKKGLKHKA